MLLPKTISSRITDSDSILKGGHFTFIVGADKQLFEVHSALVSLHSKSLGALMNNKCMEESLNGRATLSDIEPGTFVRFAEYIYGRSYSTSASDGYAEEQRQALHKKLTDADEMLKKHYEWVNFHCRRCKKRTEYCNTPGAFPYHSTACQDLDNGHRAYCLNCAASIYPDTAICTPCANKLEPNPFQLRRNTCRDLFRSQRFSVDGIEHDDVQQWLNCTVMAEKASDYLSDHAKVWVGCRTIRYAR